MMPGLTAAHRGYEYQDLLVACRLVDMLLGTIIRAHVDEKLLPNDRFDDLTTVDVDGNRERVQFKHTDNDVKPLALTAFTKDDRGLRLDRIIASILSDRSGAGSDAVHHLFRVVVRDQLPTDPRLTAVLVPTAVDPGPFIPGMPTTRLAFDSEALWVQANSKTNPDSYSDEDNFAFLVGGGNSLSRADLEWACRHLVIEVAAPPASGDLTTPELAELMILKRVRNDVGAGAYPNINRSAVDVAAAMIGTVRAARQGRLVVSADELLRRAQLRHDFGAVSRAHPVNREVEVSRTRTVRLLAESAAGLAHSGGKFLVVGPPGQGKSWVCQQLLDELSSRGWLTAEHYCYLGDADSERAQRVLAEAVFGSLLGRLADADPRLVTEQRPRFAADEEALVNCVTRSLQDEPERPIALVVDGIDHITRIRSGGTSFDPSLRLAEALGALVLPVGSVLIVLSQPGAHLRPLEAAGATSLPVPNLDEGEIRLLAARLGVVPPIGKRSQGESRPLLEAEEDVAAFLPVLIERSAGNALYATYLCREVLRQESALADPAAVMRGLPPFDGTLESYYKYLQNSLGEENGWVADIIALVDFSLTRTELRDIRPDAAHHVDRALKVLEPVLIERAAQGGIRIYHESFARFLRQPFQENRTTLGALLDRISTWLEKKGFFADPRAFRSLLPLLAQAGRDAEVVALIGRDFVVRSVAAGFPASSINDNIAVAIGSAARIGSWPVITRYIELSRAADAYQSERFDSLLVKFADVPMALLGPNVVADRLLFEDRLVMPARAGLQMCAAVDARGAVAPWRQYMAGYLRENKTDNTAYGADSDRELALAWMRGRLRLSVLCRLPTSANALSSDTVDVSRPNGQDDPSSPINWRGFARWVEELKLPASPVVQAVLDTYGLSTLTSFVDMLDRRGDMCLAVAESIGADGNNASSAPLWAAKAAEYGTTPGVAYRLLALGVNIKNVSRLSISAARDRLLTFTRDVQQRSSRWNSNLGHWLDACAIAARQDIIGLNGAEALIVGEGWYRCWLRLITALVRAEAAEATEQSRLAINAVRCLTEDLNPFSGDPRSCDLYEIHDIIEKTIRRAMALVDDCEWAEALALLREVSRSVTTSIWREMGGPLPPDLLLRIAVDGVNPARESVVRALVNEEVECGSARRYYTDLAEYRLLAARLALASDNREEAVRLWGEACEMLTAYGWHKDITIYELLDPLPALITLNPAQGRIRVARVQPVCERVPLHTDGKGTRGAWERWWELLAKADPVALASLAAHRLLLECNDPNWLLHGALEDLWKEWQSNADPIISGALRLSLDTTLDTRDAQALARIADFSDGDYTGNSEKLMTLLLARVDERPVKYSYSNSNDLLAKDDDNVEQIDLVAQRANLPPVVPIHELRSDDARSGYSGSDRQESSPTLQALPLPEVTHCFGPSVIGLSQAIRAWRNQPYRFTRSESWEDYFGNVIGYRLVELVDAGREEDVTIALRSLADASKFERSSILRSVAQGLERLNQRRLASIAYTLAWTRSRGHGGWLTFGGETEIDSLARAAQLDSEVSLRVVADEVQRVIADGYGSYGISQALIHGFGVGALVLSGTSSVETAFAAWDEAFSVIERRAPRVHLSDDPEDIYVPPDSDEGEVVCGDLDTAFTLGTLAGLAHPGREKKRRTLLATQLLLAERPAQAATAINIALTNLSDPATLTWLLRVVEENADELRLAVLATCREALVRLATGPYLTVRALARRLLLKDKPPLPPPRPPDSALVDTRGSIGLWIPAEYRAEPEQEDESDEFLDSVAGTRLGQGELMLPGLRRAVRARLAVAMADENRKKKLQAQIDAFADRVNERWPDAYLVPQQTIEEVLQLVASGGRAARIVTGRPIKDPVEWEATLANVLLDDPILPLVIEGLRQPRPPIEPPPGLGHKIWGDIRLAAELGQHNLVGIAAVEREDTLSATIAVEPPDKATVLAAGRFQGWRVIASLETRTVKHPEWNVHRYLSVRRCKAIELRISGDEEGLTLPPLAEGNVQLWRTIVDRPSQFHADLLRRNRPLIGLDDSLTAAGDGRYGLGVPAAILCPTAWLIAILGLRPGEPFVFDAEDGPGLALVIWRAGYDTSEYYLAQPQILGAAILMRKNLWDRLLAEVGGNLVFRDFVDGDSELSLTAD